MADEMSIEEQGRYITRSINIDEKHWLAFAHAADTISSALNISYQRGLTERNALRDQCFTDLQIALAKIVTLEENKRDLREALAAARKKLQAWSLPDIADHPDLQAMTQDYCSQCGGKVDPPATCAKDAYCPHCQQAFASLPSSMPEHEEDA